MQDPSAGLVDSHCHICDAAFDEDRDQVLARAERAGVGAIVAVGEDIDDARRNLALAEKYSLLRPAAGLFPNRLDLGDAEQMAAFIRKNRPRLTAIGEVGLDYWLIKDEPQRGVQREIFKLFIDLSNELDLPLNIHSRSAGRQTVALLLEHNARRVQLHAFDGKAAAALPAVEAGYFFSIPPSVVRSPQKQKLVRRLPLSCLLAETDSPVLGHLPAERNEPANLPLVVRSVACLKDETVEAVSASVKENTARLYGIQV